MFNTYPLGWEEKHLHSSWTELTQLPVKLQHQSQLGHRYPVLFSHFKDLPFILFCFLFCGVFCCLVFFSLGDDVFYLVPAGGSQRNQFHQPMTNLLKNGAWLHSSNHRNPLRTLSLEPPWFPTLSIWGNSIQYFILTLQLLTARYRMLLEPKVKCNKRHAALQKK